MQRWAATSHVKSENKTHGIVGRASDGRVDWNDGKRQAENGIKYQKNRSFAAIFINQICFDADVTGNKTIQLMITWFAKEKLC